MPGRASFAAAAGLVIGGGPAMRACLAGGGSRPTKPCSSPPPPAACAAPQIAAAVDARPLGVASPPNHSYLRDLGASEVFDYHAAGRVQPVRAAVPGRVDLLLGLGARPVKSRPARP